MRKLAEQIQAEEQELDMGQCSAAGVAGVNSARRSDNSEDEQFGNLIYLIYLILSSINK